MILSKPQKKQRWRTESALQLWYFNHNWQQQTVHLPCGVLEIALSLPGVMQTMAVTVPQFEISSGVCSRFKPQMGPLLRFWQMDPSLPGVMNTLAVIARQFEISSRVCSRFQPQVGPLLRFWKMDPSLPGVMQPWR